MGPLDPNQARQIPGTDKYVPGLPPRGALARDVAPTVYSPPYGTAAGGYYAPYFEPPRVETPRLAPAMVATPYSQSRLPSYVAQVDAHGRRTVYCPEPVAVVVLKPAAPAYPPLGGRVTLDGHQIPGTRRPY